MTANGLGIAKGGDY